MTASAVQIDMPSVQSLLVIAKAGENELGSATAFVVEHLSKQWLVTNWHVAAGRRPDTGQPSHPSGATPDHMLVWHNAEALGQWCEVIQPLYDEGGRPIWREHPEHRRSVDVVALPLDVLPAMRVYPHDLVSEDMVPLTARVSDDVSIVGFPFGLSAVAGMAIWSRGSIASEPLLDAMNRPCFLIDSRTRPGQSGSPVILYSTGVGGHRITGGLALGGGPRSRLLGVYSGRVNEQSDLGFVWKTSALQAVLERGIAGNGSLRAE